MSKTKKTKQPQPPCGGQQETAYGGRSPEQEELDNEVCDFFVSLINGHIPVAYSFLAKNKDEKNDRP